MDKQHIFAKPMTNETLDELRRRNEARVKEAVLALGTKHLLHPSNRVVRKHKSGVSA